jgi:hypothetical protein
LAALCPGQHGSRVVRRPRTNASAGAAPWHGGPVSQILRVLWLRPAVPPRAAMSGCVGLGIGSCGCRPRRLFMICRP